MVCIYCGGKTAVSNSRPQKRLRRTWRRRSCLVCRAVFTTIEAPLLSEDIIVTHGEHCSAFERDLLFVSLLASLGHRQDAVASAGSLAATITAKLLSSRPGASIEASTIARITHETLSCFDDASATHYAAYHARSLAQNTAATP